ncbi:PREDICTED: uncharacterized protein LOC100637135 [Amphimedon queenslandica]|uniref:Uncharacterized protein n=1 Tax=Amphimedon queenslandica TaxID=400682 RepID=A0A1X7U562_AMPQE|nr:PREDICTED: uncharacterized protein LOC100637135 [Amphimedon queenslandica]|eukprot:XP_003389022.1 PREDICTED: uncharacterized protein LOC100637135 [Amphimedon queenslandica]
MAEQCCYYEALRKQRILDRAYEAKCRMLSAQEKQAGFVDKAVQADEAAALKATQSSSKTESKRKKRAEAKICAVRKDLHKQEMVLRDSNLVMGYVSPKHELSLREPQKTKH